MLVGDLGRMGGVADDVEIARHGGDAGRAGEALRLDLVAHGRDGVRVGADERDAGRAQRLGEGLALGQEAVAGMDRLGAGAAAGVDDARR